ncbi:EAL domain-containing protein [Methylopila musalis]|uniref:cyclic-guanylate-specific phosphodiesterase n=1 Tax=Methylopila musalis TaxID=1134781 RepID=A0ABW3Z8L4_9HYPH
MQGVTSWRQALGVGFALIAAPVLTLNVLLAANLITAAQTETDGLSNDVLSIVEHRLDSIVETLVDVAARAAPSCEPARIEALKDAAFHAGWAADIAVIGPDDAPECSAFGTAGPLRRLSPEHDAFAPDVTVSAVEIAASRAPALAVTWRASIGGGGYRAVVSADKLAPSVMRSIVSANFLMRVSVPNGGLLLERFRDPNGVRSPSTFIRSLSSTAISERYPLTVDIITPGAALVAANRGLFVYANIGGVLVGLLFALIYAMITFRGGGPVREIADGIRRGEFEPYYQPVIDIVSGKLIGCEALVRWRRRDGVIPPGRFIPLAEASGEIYPMTLAVMTKARDDLGALYGRLPHLELGFNLVAGHFDNLDIVDDVQRIFDGSPIRMSQLMFEVTERQPLQNIARARVVISRLQQLGARVALDDVGTGHGGLSYLLKLGVDVMKMDKMFVDAIGTERYSVAIVDSLVKLAADMRLELIAEGVETFEQLQYLRQKGVRVAQGYVFAPPLPAASFLQLADAMHPAHETRAAVDADDAAPYVGPLRMAKIG